MEQKQFFSSDIKAVLRRQAIEEIFESHLKMSIDLPEQVPATMRLSAYSCSQLNLLSISGTPAQATRSVNQTFQSPDDLVLCVTYAADVCIKTSRSAEQVFQSGDAHVWKADKEFLCKVNKNFTTTMIGVPTHLIEGYGIDPQQILDQGGIASSAELRLAARYSRILIDESEHLGMETAAQTVSHLHDLITFALAREKDRLHMDISDSARAARFVSLKKDISSHLLDENLNAASIAARHGISQRYLRDIFASEQTSFSKYVLEQKLRLAHRKLSDPKLRQLNISVIAYGCGFGDLSYFTRSFKRLYGATPSDVRNR